jgi:diketogulonate reductase-like aldo/keto reductase
MGVSASTRDAEVAALRLGLDLGMTLIDTAEMYADGGAERVVGEALRGRREQAFVVSKVLPQNASRKGTIAACERSLRRLQLDRLDLYLLHWDGPHPLADTLAAFAELQAAGRIRAFGLSNFDHDQMHHRGLTANQVLYNLQRRGVERRLLPECARRGIAVMAYSPLDQGRLRQAALGPVAERLRCTPAQLALAWTLRHPHVVAIPKAAAPAHVRDDAAAFAVLARIGEREWRELDAAFPAPDRDVPLETT